MNIQAIKILYLKDLFLARWPLFGYFAAGIACTLLTCIPNEAVDFTAFILMVTVAIASGIHLLGTLLLSESTDNTRLFVMSLPVNLVEYSLAKIAVILTTYLIPWSTMLAGLTILTLAVPGTQRGIVAVLPVIFLCLMAFFTIQLVTAVVTQSTGWTICVMVACNVLFNLFLRHIYSIPEVVAATKSDQLTWPLPIVQLLTIEVVVITTAIAIALLFQLRRRDVV